MPSFGQKLKHERESRHTSIEEIAGTTGIHLDYLAALEHDRFDALPGRAFGKFYIRAYAEVLGFDPQPLIAHYDRETVEREPPEPPELPKKRRIRFRPSAPAPIIEEETAETADAPVEPPATQAPARQLAIEEPVSEVTEPAAAELANEAPEQETSGPLERDESDVATQPIEIPRDEPHTAAESAEPSSLGVPSAVAPIEPDLDQVEPTPLHAESQGASHAGLDSEETAGRVIWWNLSTAVATSVVLVLAMIGIYAALSGGDEADVEAPAQAAPPSTERAAFSQPANDPAELSRSEKQELPVAAAPTPSPPAETEQQGPTPSDITANLSVSEFGVGRRVVNHQLQDTGDRFEEGEVVWFSTRVLGGGPGHQVRHVWTLDGKTMQSLDLELGGPHWRTHSRKTLWGHGNWTAEARDSSGRVLARATFTVVPRDS
jgi:cytoskeletal protein RodZ